MSADPVALLCKDDSFRFLEGILMILQRVSNDADGRMGPWGQFTWQTSLGRKQRHTAFTAAMNLQRYRSINVNAEFDS